MASLRAQLSGADEKPAQAFVNKMYQKFSDILPSTAKETCRDTDLRQQWIRDWYWKTLQDYVAVVKDAYMPHIDITAFTEDERQQMENLHCKLSKQDQQAVLLFFTAEYDKYFDSLDKSDHEACDEQMLQCLQHSWLSENYVATMEQYVAKEKDKFELDTYVEAMTPKLQEAAKALLPCLRHSEAAKVEMGLSEERSKPKAAGTVFYWKEPSRGAKRRAKAAAAAKTAAASSKDLDSAAQVFVSETRHENMIQFMRGTSHSDTDDDSGDSNLPDLSDMSHFDAQVAKPEESARAEASVSPLPAAAVLQELQDVPGDASS